MPLRTAEQYLESLRDGRTVYYRGQRVPDVTTHPVIGRAAQHAAIDYTLAEDPAHRELCVVSDANGEYSRYYHLPRSPDDLQKRRALIELATTEGATLVILIKEIGTDALCGLLRVSSLVDQQHGTEYTKRVQDYYEHCRDNDLALAVAQTDVKGDRSLGPSAQDDPDLYVHIVDRRSDGIVVRGAKCHTSVSTNANEVIVLPTRAMREGATRDEILDAILCAYPAAGLTKVVDAIDILRSIPDTTPVGSSSPAVTGSSEPASVASPDHVTASDPTWHRVATLTDLPDGKGHIVAVEGQRLALFRIGDQVHATANACVHLGGELGHGYLSGTTVTCPLHGWDFDVTDGHCRNHGGEEVEAFETRVEDGEVRVLL